MFIQTNKIIEEWSDLVTGKTTWKISCLKDTLVSFMAIFAPLSYLPDVSGDFLTTTKDNEFFARE